MKTNALTTSFLLLALSSAVSAQSRNIDKILTRVSKLTVTTVDGLPKDQWPSTVASSFSAVVYYGDKITIRGTGFDQNTWVMFEEYSGRAAAISPSNIELKSDKLMIVPLPRKDATGYGALKVSLSRKAEPNEFSNTIHIWRIDRPASAAP